MNSSWREKTLRDTLEIDIDLEEVNPTKSYNFAGVYGFGKGLFVIGYRD